MLKLYTLHFWRQSMFYKYLDIHFIYIIEII